ncbi:hypothetical protein KBC03_03525 [Patescibacteria group bacterium]|nr:hypothetical protein [Patescibacteria group bacterium]
MTDLKNDQASLDINNKIGYVVANYLTKTDKPSAAIVPGYEPEGYELAYINSDGNDIIKTTSIPSIVDNITQKKISTARAVSSSDAMNAALDVVDTDKKDKCGIEKNATVPLLKWPSALVCRMKSLKEMSLKDVVKINFKNAQ